MTAIVIYVDDLIITGNIHAFLADTKKRLNAQIEIIDMGLLHFFLGFEIRQHQQGIFISQQRYV